MNARQIAAFEAGSGAAPNELLLAIAGVTLMLALLWTSWVAIGSFMAFQESQQTLFDLIINVLRACIVLLVLGFYIR